MIAFIAMQTIASTYVRTPQGRVTAFSATTRLPAHLKTLLQAIDGRTPSGVLAARLSGLGNVAQWLGQLETAGLIEDKHATARSSGFGQDSDQIWGHSRAPAPRPALHVVPPTPGISALGLLAAAAPRADAWQATATGDLEDNMPSRSMETILADLTQQVADEMATFVLTYLPNQAFHLLRELETLRSPVQLRAMLPSYEMLVQSVGHAGRQHLSELQQLIARQFVAS